MFIFILMIHLIYTWIQDTKFIYKSSHLMNVVTFLENIYQCKNAFSTLTTKIKLFCNLVIQWTSKQQRWTFHPLVFKRPHGGRHHITKENIGKTGAYWIGSAESQCLLRNSFSEVVSERLAILYDKLHMQESQVMNSRK